MLTNTLTRIELDAAALLHNYDTFVRIVGPDKFAPVIKSNAYGHGFTEVYQIIAQRKPRWLCVNYVSEARELRQLGFRERILAVGAIAPDSIAEARGLNLDVFVSNSEVLDAWLAAAQKPRAHIKFDTGLSRQGFAVGDASRVADLLVSHRQDVRGICSHFANVEDITEQQYAAAQLAEFKSVRQVFGAKGFDNILAHISASASALILPESRLDLARVGISLYGVWPSQMTKVSFMQGGHAAIELKPVLSWRTAVVAVKPVVSGRYVGYGCTFRASRDMRVAIVPVGYYEGLPRLITSAPSYVLLRGQRCPFVGRISMNMAVIDVSHVHDVASGDRVTLIGTDASEQITAADVAGWAQTIHYELLTRLNAVMPRVIVNAT